MSNSSFTPIPEFASTPEEMSTAIRALKMAVEQLGGLRQSESRGAPQVFVQTVMPNMARRIAYKTGDLWVNTSNNTLNYWSGNEWKQIS